MTITTKVLACGAAATAAAGALLCGGTAVADANCGKPTCFTSIRVDNGVIVADWQSPITGPYTVLDQLELSQGLDPSFGPHVLVRADDSGHGFYRSGIAARPGYMYTLRVRSCSRTVCGPWETSGFHAPDAPESPPGPDITDRQVQLAPDMRVPDITDRQVQLPPDIRVQLPPDIMVPPDIKVPCADPARVQTC